MTDQPEPQYMTVVPRDYPSAGFHNPIPQTETDLLLWGAVRHEMRAQLHAPKRVGDVGMDLEVSEQTVIHVGRIIEVPTNLRVRLPRCTWGEIRARSSATRQGLIVQSNTIDTEYTGELFICTLNSGPDPITLQAGDRIAQLVLHVAYRCETLRDDSFAHSAYRGEAGFGSTGR